MKVLPYRRGNPGVDKATDGSREGMSMKMLMGLMVFLLSIDLLAASSYPPVTVKLPLKQVAEHTYYTLGAAGVACG